MWEDKRISPGSYAEQNIKHPAALPVLLSPCILHGITQQTKQHTARIRLLHTALKISILMRYEKQKTTGPYLQMLLRAGLYTKPLNNVFNVANIAYMWGFYLPAGRRVPVSFRDGRSEGRMKRVPGKKNPRESCSKAHTSSD